MKKSPIVLTRILQTNSFTIGFIADLNLYSLELPWRDNKVNVSCIPKGVYSLAKYKSTRFPLATKIKSVEGRTNILIHPLNTLKETRGCIGLGKNTFLGYQEFLGSIHYATVRNSRKATNIFLDHILINNITEIEIK